MESDKRIFVIPHFHYDVSWLNSEKENLERVYKILSRVVEVMQEEKDFKYVVDQAFYLEKLKNEKPKLFNQVADRIREGRIEVVNAGYVMPDLNLISPLAVKKNFELMNSFALKEFDKKPEVAWMIDCFGHPGIMPKTAREANLKYYVFWRGMNQPDSTQEFHWVGSDGTSILAHWMKHSYSVFGYRLDNLARTVLCNSEPTTNNAFIPYGSDFCFPHKKFIQQVHKTRGARFALPSEFFRELEKHVEDLPVVKGEMTSDYANFKGCYSSRISYKQLYRNAEKELLSREADDEEWKKLLYAAFHDFICGTSFDAAYPSVERKLKTIKTAKKATRNRKGTRYNGQFLLNVSCELVS
jgi:alpha-mannosidase